MPMNSANHVTDSKVKEAYTTEAGMPGFLSCFSFLVAPVEELMLFSRKRCLNTCHNA